MSMKALAALADPKTGRLPSVVAVSAPSHGALDVTWTDGVSRRVDVSDIFEARYPLARALADPVLFNDVKVGEFGGLQWGNGMDMCPHALRMKADEQHAAHRAAE